MNVDTVLIKPSRKQFERRFNKLKPDYEIQFGLSYTGEGYELRKFSIDEKTGRTTLEINQLKLDRHYALRYTSIIRHPKLTKEEIAYLLGGETEWEGKCPYCESEWIDFIDEDGDSAKYICRDCGRDFIVLEDSIVRDRNMRMINEDNVTKRQMVGYGINIQKSGEPYFSRYATVDSYETAKQIFDVLVIDNELRLWENVEVEEIFKTIDKDFEYKTIMTTQQKEEK